eukprot:CAMPEP_0198524252 /NCGR_PEP_ID=MMETSP1462-20131121/22640_1 /TAXON_ID=1333877 /ORGANISM="Brandtodinium nutriculum, Strain RCC3387" /LENGTH=77 /DNA_ID=CAMNT_0044253975 /DNA_START=195 /DNA_END=425 /DNA_ORIENTATION=+
MHEFNAIRLKASDVFQSIKNERLSHQAFHDVVDDLPQKPWPKDPIKHLNAMSNSIAEYLRKSANEGNSDVDERLVGE